MCASLSDSVLWSVCPYVSLHPSTCLSDFVRSSSVYLCPSVWLPVLSVPDGLSVHPCVCMCSFVRLSVLLSDSVRASVSTRVHVTLRLANCASVRLFVRLRPSVRTSVRLSVHPPVWHRPPARPYVWLCPSFCLWPFFSLYECVSPTL